MGDYCLQCENTELLFSLKEIAADISLPISMNGQTVILVQRDKGIHIRTEPNQITIFYGERCEAFRALGLLKELKISSSDAIDQNSAFSLRAVLLDCSRNAVLKMDTLQRIIRYCAVMGFNALMLYTEDTIELPAYPYFGYMRGAYTAEEIQQLDQYADRFGIELIPCIQTLAHFTAPIRWECFAQIQDTRDILLLEDEKTNQFLDALVCRMRELFRSRRIHVGFDEAHMVGLGKYLDIHGYTDRAGLLVKHVHYVEKICEKYDFQPMMWSDMFYGICGGGYRDDLVTEQIRSSVPEKMQLVAWDYYTEEQSVYDQILESHQKFNRDILFAGGAWKWLGFSPHISHSLELSKTALQSCLEHHVREIIVTAWGDDGAEASVYGILPVMQLFAEFSYEASVSENRLAQRFHTCTGCCWEDFLAIDVLNIQKGNAPNAPGPANPSKYMLYQDVLLGLFDKHIEQGQYSAAFADAKIAMNRAAERNLPVAFLFRTLEKLAGVLQIKCDLGVRLRKFYKDDDKAGLQTVREDLQLLQSTCEQLYQSVCEQWDNENKPFGREVIDARFGTLAFRLRAAQEKLVDYLTGKSISIPELEVEQLPYDGQEQSIGQLVQESSWLKMVTAGVIQL